jgi:hypothetical protein
MPAGRYNVRLVDSPRFGLLRMPMLYFVANSDGARSALATYFHPGHHIADAEGCIELGLEHSGARVRRTKPAFEALQGLIVAAVDEGRAVDLEIVA